FKERTSLKPVYGNMAFNGLRNNTTLRITVGDRNANITITPEDTLQTIAAKINNNAKTDQYQNEAYNLHYDDNGNEIAAITAKVVNDKLVIKRGSMAEANGSEVTISGSAALNALNLNYTYKGLYQIGIETTSDNYGISGQLDFSADEFREALEDNPDEVQTLMTSFAKQMDSYMKSMLNATSTSSGTLKTQISNIDTQITSIDEYLNNFQDRLDRMETRLRNQYAAAEERIAKLSQQASSIAGILSQMSGANNSNSNS
ncbi:MAG: flagellar filament capping protein FliD, partial [Synergistaceae bacterium]|nr:flagellar filament capping protein FliD [Synergistaceae bacterium]